MSLLEDYTSATELTHRMLEAARTQDWEELATVGSARDSLLVAPPETLPPMSARDSQQVARLIEEMLAFHDEIADHAGSWLEHTAKLLAAFDRSDSTASSMQASDPGAE
ncbi:MAG: flagellar protein FliT [Propionivibrio sp.]|nr:flagellar protein FliT [Propionivibrio sp.]